MPTRTIKLIIKESEETKKLNEDTFIKINDNRKDTPDYIIQDVTELQDNDDTDTDAPSIEGLLSLVNESLTEKYGNTWGYIKPKAVSVKEGMQYAILDIITPSILQEAKKNKINDTAVSKTIILESVPNSKLTNLKINTLAGNTRFSQKTSNPAKVLSRWLESEYLQEEMIKDFNNKMEAKQNELKKSVSEYMDRHPDIQCIVDSLKAQATLLKQAKLYEKNKEYLVNQAYAICTKFPLNINVKSDKDNKATQTFDTIDEVVELVFGKDWLKDNKDNNKSKQSIKESYEVFKIGNNIEGTFNTDTLEVIYTLHNGDKEVVDKKLDLSSIPSVDTPYNTETIIKNYLEKRHGNIPSSKDTENADNMNKVNTQPISSDNTSDETITEDDNTDTQDSNQPENVTTAEAPEAETGDAVFYKIRQNNSVSLEDIQADQDSDRQSSNYIVVETRDISPDEMKAYTADLSKPQSFLNGIESVDRKNYAFNVLKLTSNGYPTLLIDPVGYNYGRYIAIQDSTLAQPNDVVQQ
jgi:hypothetical protein